MLSIREDRSPAVMTLQVVEVELMRQGFCFFLSFLRLFVCLRMMSIREERSPAVMTQQVVEVELMRQGRQRGGSQEPVAFGPVQCL